MTYLRERGVSKRALAMVLSLLMVFSMFTMLTSYVANGAADYGLTASADGTDAIELTWNAQEGADGYTVFRSDEIDGTYTEREDTTSNTFRDTFCMPGTTYYYKVRSYKYVSQEAIEVFTIRAELYGATTDGMFVYENTSDSQLHFKSYASTPNTDDNPEAYWYRDLDGHIRNYATNNYASIGTDTVADANGSGTYGNAPMNVYASAAADGDNSEWVMQSLTCNSANGADEGGTAYVIYLASSNGAGSDSKQWASGRQKINDGLLAAPTVNKPEFTESCGRHWKVENQKVIGGTIEKVEDELSEPVSATTLSDDQPDITVGHVVVEPSTVDAGSEFTVTAIVLNSGSGLQTEPFDVSFSFNSQTQDVHVTDLTEVNSIVGTTVSATFVAPEDVSDQSQIPVNVYAGIGFNEATVTVNAPEVHVNSVRSFEATAGSAIQFDVAVENSGHMDYAGGDNMSVVFNDGTEQLVALPPIPFGQEVTVSATDVAPSQNGQYIVKASLRTVQSSSSVSGIVTVTGGEGPDDEDPYPNTPTKDPTTAPDFSVDYAEFVSGPYFIRNNYTGYGYQYLYDSLDGNDYTGTEDNRNGSDSTSYADYGRTFRQVNTDDVLSSIQNNQNYMWNIYSKTVGGTTYYMLRNVGTGRYIHTGAYGDYYSYNNDNNSANMYAWNAEITNGATGYNGDSQANRELSYYAFTLPSYNNTTGESFTTQIVNQRFAWGQRPLHGELASDHNTTERAGRVFFTSNTNGWATKNWYFNPANVATTVADLTVTSATIDPTDIPFGTEATVSATIKNDGNADIAEGTPILVKFVFNGKLATATYTGGLAAGASTDVSATIKPNKLTDGAVMTVTVNADWSLDESDFTNNTYVVENITVIDDDNPVLSVASVADVSAAAGQTYEVTAVIKNIGKVEQSDAFSVDIIVDGVTQTVNFNEVVAANGTVTATATFTAPNAANGTQYPINVKVGNSQKSATLTVMAPVLKVVSIDNVEATADKSFQIPIVVRNDGGAALEAGKTINVTFNGQTISVNVPAIGVGSTATIYATFIAPEFNGTYKVTSEGITGKVTVTGGSDADTDPEAPTEPGKGSSYYVIQSVQRNTFLADTDLEERGMVRAALASSTWDDASADKRYQWEMVDAGSGKYYLRNVATGRYLQTDIDTYYDWDETYNYNGVALVTSPTDTKAALTLTLNSTESNGNKLYTMRDDETFAEYRYYINTYHDTEILKISAADADNSRLFRFAEYHSDPADLTVNSVTVNATDISISDTLTATATIANISDSDVNNDIVVKFIFNGKITKVTHKGGLKANTTAEVVAELPANKLNDKGTTVNVTVNSDWAIGESDYTNNTASSVVVKVRQGVTMIDDFNRDTLYGLGTDVMAYEAAKDANGVIENLSDSSISLATTDTAGAELYIGRILTKEAFSQSKYLVYKIKSSEPLTSGIMLANGYRDSITDADYKDLFEYAAAENSVSKLTDGYQLVILKLDQFALREATDDFPYDIFDLSMKIAAGSGTVTIDDIYLTEELPEQPSNALITINSVTPDPAELEASGSITKKHTTFTINVTNNGTTSWKEPVIQYVVNGKTYTATVPEGTVIPADGKPYDIEVTIVNPTYEVDEITFVLNDDSTTHPTATVAVHVNDVVVDEDNHGDSPVPVSDTFIIESEQRGTYLYDDGTNVGYGVNPDGLTPTVDDIANANNIAVARMASYTGEGLPNGDTAADLMYQWYLVKQDDGNYKITNAYTGRSFCTMSTTYLGTNRDTGASHNGEANLIDYVPEDIFDQILEKEALGAGFQKDYVFNSDSKYWALETLEDHDGILREGFNDMHVAMFSNNVRYKKSIGDMASYWYYYANTNMNLSNGRLNLSGRTTDEAATHFYFWHVPKGVDLEMTNVEIYRDDAKVTSAIIKENAEDEVTVEIRATFTNNRANVIPAGSIIDVKFDFDGKIVCVPYTVTEDIVEGSTITVSTPFTTTKLYPEGLPIRATVNADWNEAAEEGKTLVHDYDIIRETTYKNNTNFETLVIDITEQSKVTIGIDFYDSDSELSGSTISLNGKVGPRTDEFDVPAEITLTAEPANGYEFAGWYREDTLLYTTATASFSAITSDVYTAKFVPAKVKLTVDVSPNNGGTDRGGTIIRKQGGGLLDIPVEKYPSVVQETTKGTAVRLVAEANEGYKFLYWTDEKGNKVSENVDYTITLNEDTTLIAVFIKQDSVTIHFVDSITGKEHYKTSVVSGTTGVTYGGLTPYIDGFRWTGWEIDLANTVFDKETIIYTTYEKVDERAHTLKIIASSATSQFTEDKDYISSAVAIPANATYQITAPDKVANQEFSYWRSRGQVICLDKTFKIQMPDSDCLIEAVYGADDVDKYKTTYCINFEGWITPVDVAGATQNAMFSLNAACVNGEGHELVAKGAILLAVEGDEIPTNMTLNTPGVKVGKVKLNVHVNENGEVYNYGYTDMYAIRLLNADPNINYYTRAFLTYKDANGVEHTVYADDIMNCSTNIHTPATSGN